MLAKDKISVPGAQKQFSNKKKTKNLHFHDNSWNFSRTDLEAKMVSLKLICFRSVCDLDFFRLLEDFFHIEKSQLAKKKR